MVFETYLIRKLDVAGIGGKVNDRAVPTDVEDDIVLCWVDVLDHLCVGQELFDLRILEELRAFVIGEVLDAGFVDGRVSALGRGKVDIEAGCFKGVIWVRGLGKIPALI
jgi:hypothetical protein